MKFAARAVIAACGAVVALTALAAGPAQADTVRVPCTAQSLLQDHSGIDLVMMDKDSKLLCFSGQSERAMQVNIYGVQALYKPMSVTSVTLLVELTMGDVGTAWERVVLDSNHPSHWFSPPAHRIDSIYIQK